MAWIRGFKPIQNSTRDRASPWYMPRLNLTRVLVLMLGRSCIEPCAHYPWLLWRLTGVSSLRLNNQGGSHHLAADSFVLPGFQGGQSACSVGRLCQELLLLTSPFLRPSFEWHDGVLLKDHWWKDHWWWGFSCLRASFKLLADIQRGHYICMEMG